MIGDVESNVTVELVISKYKVDSTHSLCSTLKTATDIDSKKQLFAQVRKTNTIRFEFNVVRSKRIDGFFAADRNSERALAQVFNHLRGNAVIGDDMGDLI